ncbi:MAG: Eco47II family restriction endonuclease [Lachnospiraceae bacterium]|nr:Eco47II family restriction endonuclease [Lachnospiraceae bacterium]
MDWKLKFIERDDFVKHVENTIAEYGNNLEPYDIRKFNSNIIDPIKMIFDKSIYRATWEQMISDEIFRQRDKANNNSIGYFHQRIFQYIDRCHVPDNGTEGGWDVIYKNDNGIALPDGDIVHTIYVEMKNKHNTMNSAAAGKTYIKMQSQLLQDDDCACFLVEAIAKKSQNIKWETTVDKKKVSHKRIRRVSIDQFYSIVTGEQDAFYRLCMALPGIIEEVVSRGENVKAPEDTVIEELKSIAGKTGIPSGELSMAMAIYLLGFNTYTGFSKDGDMLNRLYEYATGIK